MTIISSPIVAVTCLTRYAGTYHEMQRMLIAVAVASVLFAAGPVASELAATYVPDLMTPGIDFGLWPFMWNMPVSPVIDSCPTWGYDASINRPFSGCSSKTSPPDFVTKICVWHGIYIDNVRFYYQSEYGSLTGGHE